MKNFLTFLLSTIILSSSLTSFVYRPVKTPKKDPLAGFSMYPAPNDVQKPGFIFAVNRKKRSEVRKITMLPTNIESGNITIPKYEKNKNLTLAAIANFVNSNKISIDTNNELEATSNVKVHIDNATIEYVDLLKAKNDISSMQTELNDLTKTLTNLNNYDFFIIIEAVKAKKIAYGFEKKKIGSSKIDGTFKSIASSNNKITWNNKKSLQLEYDLGTPLYVFYNAFPLDVQHGATGITTFILNDNAKPASVPDNMIHTSNEL